VESPAISGIKMGPPFHFKVLHHRQIDVLVRLQYGKLDFTNTTVL
jgi:hypothetical protein